MDASPAPRPVVWLEWPRAVLVLAFIVVGFWYLSWRPGTFNPDALTFSAVLYALEIWGFSAALLHITMTWRLTDHTVPPPAEGAAVDVFIPTHSEPVDLVRATLLAARNIDYPHTTWLLDDGNRPEMEVLARELGVQYLARSDNTHAKAGNLNHGLAHSDGEFIAIFDADHAPHRRFLHETLGFFRHAGVAFVQTPQDYYNLDSFQHRRRRGSPTVWTEQSLFFRVIQRGKDAWNAAFFCGSCAVIRRSALERVGGFATETVTEDLHTSLRLHQAGYESIYHPRPLAFGQAPVDFGSFLRQRIRWGQGAMQIWRREGLLLGRGLSVAQRLNYIASMSTYFDGWQKAIFYLTPPAVMVSGVMPIESLDWRFLAHFVPYYLLGFLVFEEMARGHGQTGFVEQYNMSRFAGFAWATLGLFKRSLRFRVTSKTRTRAGSGVALMIPQITVGAANLTAIPPGIWNLLDGDLSGPALAANMFWASVHVVLATLVLIFTMTNADMLRGQYRFPLPLLARVRDGDSHRLSVVRDISTGGCRLFGEWPGVRRGEALQAELITPERRIPVTLQVSRVGRQDLGCRFDWASTASRDELTLFLHGSDLQWQLQSLSESVLTPLQKLLPGLLPASGQGPMAGIDHWTPLAIQARTGERSELALVGVPRGHPTDHLPVLLFARVTPGRVRAMLLRRDRQERLIGELSAGTELVSPTGSLYHHTLTVLRRRLPVKTPPILRPGRTRRRPASAPATLTGLLGALAFAVLGAAPAQANNTMLLTGTEVSGGSNLFGYAGVIAPLPGRAGDSGWRQRYWLDHVEYRYDGAQETFEADSTGVSAALGYGRSGYDTWWSAYAGVAYRDTGISPSDPSNPAEGTNVRGQVLADAGWFPAPRWLLMGNVSWIFGQDAYWVRGRALYRPGRQWRTGPEIIAHGDPEYDVVQAGWVVGAMQWTRRTEGTLRAGARFTDPGSTRGYLGFEVLHYF